MARPPSWSNLLLALLLCRLLEAMRLYDEYERGKGAIGEPEAAALRAHRRRLAALMQARARAAPEEGDLCLPLARLLTGLGEWQGALEAVDRARRARGAQP